MLKVIGWIDYDNFNFRTSEGSDEEFKAVAENIKANGYKFGGDDHENHSSCTPLLSNGSALRVSWRNWGYVMALAYDLKTDKDEYNYILWYMGEYGPDERKFPCSFTLSSLNSCDIPKGKEYIYELSEKELHAINDVSLTSLVLPLEIYESSDLKTFDHIVFKHKDNVILSGYINEIRFGYYSIDEFFKKDKDLNSCPADNTNLKDFDNETLIEFFKSKYNLVSSTLVSICFDNDEDNRNPADLYV